MTAPIEWADDGPAAVRHVAAGAAVGVAFLLVGGALAFGWTALRAGAYDRLLALALALALLPLTGRALLGIRAVGAPTDASLSRRPLLVAGGAWALVLAAVLRWRPLVAVALLAGAAGLWIVAAACRTRGRLDPAAGTLTYGGRTASLAGLDGVRRVPLGIVSVYWLDFARGSVGSGVPRTVVVPRRVDADVRVALDAAATGDADAAATDGAGRGERAAAATLGLGFLLAGPVAWLLLPASADATLVTGYLTLLGLPFAVLLLRYALVA
ncbi:hypothetical protein DU500_09740 [Haloplanus rubicundus]|uniref:Uncharacterized protein n=1 Tax=Haloplanus rubicundus TaxID=1547898 RepID=A0A345E3B6_9EURY|nr:hypothetical protein [Haloplanus rubicundus]AXG06688.1 hypothetical protein DU500_09740 [Haloplanus rubicundus]